MTIDADYQPSPVGWVRDQVAAYEASNGAEANSHQGLPVIILSSIGAKSGQIRKTPLMRVEHNGRYVVVASTGGAPKNPTWYFNVKANPSVELRDRAEVSTRIAREIFDDEYEQWWVRAVSAYTEYADLRQKACRHIPLFVLEPAG